MECMELAMITRGGHVHGDNQGTVDQQQDQLDQVGLYDSCWNIHNNNTCSTVFSDKIHTVTRLKKVSDQDWDYSGILYTNRIRADQSIILSGIGFFGPSKKDGDYLVDIEIEEEFYQSREPPRKIFSIRKEPILAEKQEIFFCDFPTSRVILHSNKWYSIRFQLNGPPTCQGSTHLSNARVANVEFDFHYGSNQMPMLKFTPI